MFGPADVQYTRKMHKFKFEEKYFPKMQVYLNAYDTMALRTNVRISGFSLQGQKQTTPNFIRIPSISLCL